MSTGSVIPDTKSATPAPNLAASVNAAQGAKLPKGLTTSNSRDLATGTQFFHGLIYGGTDCYKTTTAASFGGPERTLIVNTRSPEQMIPLTKEGYRVARATDAEGLLYAMQFPERVADSAGWPEWKDLPERVLMIDDMSAGSDFLVDENSTNADGKELKDGRKIYSGVNDDLREALAAMKRKPQHLIFTALADVSVSQLENEEIIYPKLPKGVRVQLTADLEFVFFVKRAQKKLLTTTSYMQYVKKDEKTGKPTLGRREIFAKSKMSRELSGRVPPVIALEEGLDLALLWKKIREAK